MQESLSHVKTEKFRVIFIKAAEILAYMSLNSSWKANPNEPLMWTYMRSIFKWKLGERFKERRKRIAQIYTQISVIMGNWKNQLKSHGVPLSVIWPRWERLAKQKSQNKRNIKIMWGKKKNQSLYTGSPNLIESC